jgi:putative ABC transport system permease protein
MAPSSLFVRLAVQHMGHRPVRTALLACAVAIGGSAIFGASVLRQAIQNGLGTSLDRLGADLMVVPRETTVNLSSALLTVEPTSERLDAATVSEIARLQGVAVAAPQQYFALPTAGDSHGGEDLIAFDPERDFTVLPWLSEKLDRPFDRGDVIVGGRRTEAVGGEIRLFGRPFFVYGRLGLTGVGPFERGIFVSFTTARDIASAARETTGRSMFDPRPDSPSALLIRLGVGGTHSQFRFAAARLSGVQVVAGNGLNTGVRQGMSALLSGLVLFSVLILLATSLMVGVTYSGLLSERRRVLGLLLAIGMRPAQLIRLILAEAALTTSLGGVCGVVLGAAGLVLCQRSLGFYFENLDVPFTLPSAKQLLVMGLVSIGVCSLVGMIGALLPAWQAGRSEPYELVRGEGA